MITTELTKLDRMVTIVDNYFCSSDLDTWRIVGIVIGIVVNITGCVVICVCCYRRRASPGQVLQPNAGTQMGM
ncbi:hypothetical protein DPMN_138291 [Dreissena polymorpha]|uniref:Uncharacterized protein n=1 Tax=Dreissena polymorpha TaxID=45954 RepID=A0A9D4G6D2_DREPO|nr:hypothetical protein DPMN_138291 [Dreissena polymorpha]